MHNLQLITGNRNFSSSSLRAWLLLQEFEIPFTEVILELYKTNSAEKVGMYSPSLQVPVLIHNDIKVWDSLAICEYVSETFLEFQGWPMHAKKRAAARSICTELHADFQHFKKDWPMNCQLSLTLMPSEAIEKEIARLDAMIYCCRRKYGDGGDYLLGKFSITDCMFAPFAVSLNAYGAELSHQSQHYLNTLLTNSHMQWWLNQADKEIEEHRWKKTA
jgi:glutathione S-transferase